MVNTYSGESIAKKIARIRLYTRVKQALDFCGIKDMMVFFLIGPDASEVGAIKHILGVPADRVVGLDRDEDACRCLEQKWPGANVVHGDLMCQQVMNRVEEMSIDRMIPYAFIHLDLMGPLSQKSELIYRSWSRLCKLNCVLAVTYLRAREPRNNGTLGQMRAVAKKLAAEYRKAKGEGKKYYWLMSADPERALSHLAALGHNGNDFKPGLIKHVTEAIESGAHPQDVALSARDFVETSFTPLATYSYRSDNSPMGVLATQLVTIDMLDSDSYALLRYAHGRHTTSVIRKNAMLDLLADVDSLEKRYTRQQVCEILDVSPGTLSAWKAHRTMDTYDH